jgi:putative transcriptional regulator
MSITSNTLNRFALGSLRHHFLIAMPSMSDPTFVQSVTYICEHDADGAMGLVINRPMNLTVGQVLQPLGLTEPSSAATTSVLSGGPVSPERGFILHSPTERPWQSTTTLADELCLTVSSDILRSLAKDEGPEHYLVILGYAGWGAGQLEQEIAENAWLTLPAEPSVLFHTPTAQRWSAAASALGVDLNLIANTVGHA